VRIRLAELLVRGYDEQESDSPFANWTREQWLDFSRNVEGTVNLALRHDATVKLSGPQGESLRNDDATARRMPPVWLRNAKRSILGRISLNAAVAPIRQELERLLIALENHSNLFEYSYVSVKSRRAALLFEAI
jgi:hypothetical protein